MIMPMLLIGFQYCPPYPSNVWFPATPFARGAHAQLIVPGLGGHL